MMKRIKNFRIPLVVVVMIVFSCFSTALSEYSYSQQQKNEKYHITQVSPQGYGDDIKNCDATDEYIYIGCSDQALIDVFYADGSYAFTLHFSRANNGGLKLCCRDGYLYVLTKYKNVFIFYGEELVEQITSEAAKQLGYTSSWFNSDERNLRWDGNNLYRTASNNAQGDIVQIDPDYVNNFNSSRFFAPLLIFFFLMSPATAPTTW